MKNKEDAHMLNLANFDATMNALRYLGENHYTIISAAPLEGYTVIVSTLDENGNAIDGPCYVASTISQAVAIVEALENGQEI